MHGVASDSVRYEPHYELEGLEMGGNQLRMFCLKREEGKDSSSHDECDLYIVTILVL